MSDGITNLISKQHNTTHTLLPPHGGQRHNHATTHHTNRETTNNKQQPKRHTKQVVDDAATERKQAAEDARAKEAGEEPKKVDPVMKTEYEDVYGWRLQNDNKPIWTRAPKVCVRAGGGRAAALSFIE